MFHLAEFNLKNHEISLERDVVALLSAVAAHDAPYHCRLVGEGAVVHRLDSDRYLVPACCALMRVSPRVKCQKCNETGGHSISGKSRTLKWVPLCTSTSTGRECNTSLGATVELQWLLRSVELWDVCVVLVHGMPSGATLQLKS